MGSDIRIIRPIEVHDTKIDYYFNSLIKFLGENEIQKKIDRVKRTYEFEKGSIYKRFFLDRKYSWWNSLIKIYEFKKNGKSFRMKFFIRKKFIQQFSSWKLLQIYGNMVLK